MFRWLFGGRKPHAGATEASVAGTTISPISVAVAEAPVGVSGEASVEDTGPPGEGVAILKKLDTSTSIAGSGTEGILPDVPDENGRYSGKLPGSDVVISVSEVRSETGDTPVWKSYVDGVPIGGEYPSKSAAQQAAMAVAGNGTGAI